MSDRQLHTFMQRLRRITGPKGASGLTDAQLLERFVSRQDEAAFEVLVWRHGPTVATTTPEDHQTIARLLLEQVSVTVEGNTDRAEIELRWAGGFSSYHTF